MSLRLCACAALVAAAASDQRGHVIVSKHLSAPATKEYIVQGLPFEVHYTVMNLGAEPAYAVSVEDVFPAHAFEMRAGQPRFKEAELAPGANATFSVTLVPKVAGVMTVGLAEVRYRYRLPPEDEEGGSSSGGAASEGADAAAAADGSSGLNAEDEDLLVDAHTSSATPQRTREILRPDVYARVTKQRAPTAVGVSAAAVALILAPYWMFTAAKAK